MRRLVRSVAPFVAALVVVAAAGSGLRYLWCAPMGEARLECCCPHRPSADARLSASCCEVRRVPALPSVERIERPSTPLFVLAVLWELPRVLEPAPVLVPARSEHGEARAGPDEPVHALTSRFLI